MQANGIGETEAPTQRDSLARPHATRNRIERDRKWAGDVAVSGCAVEWGLWRILNAMTILQESWESSKQLYPNDFSGGRLNCPAGGTGGAKCSKWAEYREDRGTLPRIGIRTHHLSLPAPGIGFVHFHLAFQLPSRRRESRQNGRLGGTRRRVRFASGCQSRTNPYRHSLLNMSYILSSNTYRPFPSEALGHEEPVSGVKLELS